MVNISIICVFSIYLVTCKTFSNTILLEKVLVYVAYNDIFISIHIRLILSIERL